MLSLFFPSVGTSNEMVLRQVLGIQVMCQFGCACKADQSSTADDSENWMSSSFSQPKERRDWLNWKIVEERKRTHFRWYQQRDGLAASSWDPSDVSIRLRVQG
jgi:hypothetical protein